jgi:hypothetical protein
MGKQRTVHGSYSGDFEESKVGGRDFDDLAYYPGSTPGKFVGNAKGTNKIDLSKAIDSNFYDSIGTEGDMLKGGFSGPISRNRK